MRLSITFLGLQQQQQQYQQSSMGLILSLETCTLYTGWNVMRLLERHVTDHFDLQISAIMIGNEWRRGIDGVRYTQERG